MNPQSNDPAQSQQHPLSELHPSTFNPRTINEFDAKNLHMSMSDFGDLSSIVFNVRAGINSLVGGHQRIADLMKDPRSFKNLIHKFEQPDSQGTTALGFIEVRGTDIRLPYREVDWDLVKHKQAMLLANRAQGENVLPMLATITKELAALGEDVVAKTGQRKDEIKALIKSLDKPKEPEPVPDKIIYSQPHTVYQVGAHRITTGMGDLEFIDQIRQDFADKNGAADWQEFTPPISQN